jgi:hypothetical protein
MPLLFADDLSIIGTIESIATTTVNHFWSCFWGILTFFLNGPTRIKIYFHTTVTWVRPTL